MNNLPLISGYTAVLLAMLQVTLMIKVGNARRASNIPLGDGGKPDLLMKIRRHANLAENAPLFLILLGFLESMNGPKMAVITLASVFLVARLSHAYALSGPDKPLAARAVGAFGTVFGVAGGATALLWHLITMS